MSTRAPRDSDPLAAAQAREFEDDSRPAATAINLPPLRSRTVVLNNSLQAQWRGTAGRSHNPNSYVSDSQRHWVLLVLGLLAALLIVGTLHFSEPHGAHPQAVLPPDHPHMLKRAAAMAAQAAAASSGSAIVGPNPLASAFSVLYVTVPSAEVANKLASGLLEAKLIACANIVPGVTSMYRWEGKIQTDQEQLMMVRRGADREDSGIAAIWLDAERGGG